MLYIRMLFPKLYMMAQEQFEVPSNGELVSNIYVGLKNDVLSIFIYKGRYSWCITFLN